HPAKKEFLMGMIQKPIDENIEICKKRLNHWFWQLFFGSSLQKELAILEKRRDEIRRFFLGEFLASENTPFKEIIVSQINEVTLALRRANASHFLDDKDTLGWSYNEEIIASLSREPELHYDPNKSIPSLFAAAPVEKDIQVPLLLDLGITAAGIQAQVGVR